MAFEVVRVAAVIALLCTATLTAAPPGRLPPAVRGIARLFGASVAPAAPVSRARRFFAFALVLLAACLAVW